MGSLATSEDVLVPEMELRLNREFPGAQVHADEKKIEHVSIDDSKTI